MQSTPLKAGSYAVATSKARPWLSTPIVQTTAKPKRAKIVPVVKNSIFLECAKLTDDTFWIAFFNQAAYGKLPRGFMFNEMSLNYKRGTRNIKIEIPLNPIDALSVTISFLASSAGIMSEADQLRMKRNRDVQNANSISIQNCSWSQIKKDGIKDILIHNFIRDVITRFSLNDLERRQMETTIRLGFFLGYFQAKHVIFIKGKIMGILGLNFDTERRVFFMDKSLTPKPSKSISSKKSAAEKTLEKKSFANQWAAFNSKIQEKTKKKRQKTPSESRPVGETSNNSNNISSLVPEVY